MKTNEDDVDKYRSEFDRVCNVFKDRYSVAEVVSENGDLVDSDCKSNKRHRTLDDMLTNTPHKDTNTNYIRNSKSNPNPNPVKFNQ
jgi:hypothetical protein